MKKYFQRNMLASIILKWEYYNRSNIEFCIRLSFLYILNNHFWNFIIYLQNKITNSCFVHWKSPGILFRNLIDVWRGKEKASAKTGNLSGNNKTVEEVKEEKELGDELEDSLNSVELPTVTKPANKTSRNDNKKDESVRWLAKLLQLMAEVSLEIDEILLSMNNARFHNFEIRAL